MSSPKPESPKEQDEVASGSSSMSLESPKSPEKADELPPYMGAPEFGGVAGRQEPEEEPEEEKLLTEEELLAMGEDALKQFAAIRKEIAEEEKEEASKETAEEEEASKKRAIDFYIRRAVREEMAEEKEVSKKRKFDDYNLDGFDSVEELLETVAGTDLWKNLKETVDKAQDDSVGVIEAAVTHSDPARAVRYLKALNNRLLDLYCLAPGICSVIFRARTIATVEPKRRRIGETKEDEEEGEEDDDDEKDEEDWVGADPFDTDHNEDVSQVTLTTFNDAETLMGCFAESSVFIFVDQTIDAIRIEAENFDDHLSRERLFEAVQSLIIIHQYILQCSSKLAHYRDVVLCAHLLTSTNRIRPVEKPDDAE